MDASFTEENKNPNPIRDANFFSKLTFVYMVPIFKRGCKKGLTEEDLFAPLDEHKSGVLGEKIERLWCEHSKRHKSYGLCLILFKMFGFTFIVIGFIKLFIEIMLVVALPICVGKIVAYFKTDQTQITEFDVYIYTAILIVVFFADQLLTHSHMMALMHTGMKLRVSCNSLIYRKTLKLTSASLGKTTVGQIVNLLSNDVSKLERGLIISHYAWIGPIQATVGTYIIYKEIGVAAVFGVAFLLIFIPFQIWLGKAASDLRLKTAIRTDERVRLMNEIISGIQVIKMYTWEKPFSKLIEFARKKEIDAIRAHSYLLAMILSFGMFVTRTSVFISILGYVLLGNTLTAEKAFVVTAVYSQIRVVITVLFSSSIMSVAEAFISMFRIQTFLSHDELPNQTVNIPNLMKLKRAKDAPNSNKLTIIEGVPNLNQLTTAEDVPNLIQPKVSLEKVSAKWSGDDTRSILQEIDFQIAQNQLVAIVGPVGSGKTSLFNVILKELPIHTGTMEIVGEISYSCQEPWLFMGSIKQNILFGEEFDEDRYNAVVKVCALESDFDLLPYRDRTLVGEKGKTLSGGQKARVNLARCVYKKADIYLLDDPLSAVDANVGKHLYEECIKKFLSGTICILITHQLQYLRNANKIVVMKQGKIEIEGSYDELQTSGVDFTKLLEQFHEQHVEEEFKIDDVSKKLLQTVADDDQGPEIGKEFLTVGSVDMSIYAKYLKAGGNRFMVAILVLAFVCSQLFLNGGDYYLTYWVNLEQELGVRITNNLLEPNETFSRNEIIYIYSGITAGAIFFAVFHTIYFFIFLMLASMNLHNQIFSKIIKATMVFFNENPSGRILNRFSKDLGIIDEHIPSVLFDVIEICLLLIGTIVLTCVVNFWLLPPSIILLIVFFILRNVYLKTSRSVKRIEGNARSPILGHMSASLQGLSTIRAFKKQQALIDEFDRFQDRHSSAWFLFFASQRAFNFWSDIITITFISGVILTLLSFKEELYSGDMGLIITQYFGLIGNLQYAMSQWSELENQMTSVERLLEYTKADTEPERTMCNNTIIANWPEKGKIEFRDVSMRYTPSDVNVLKSLRFTIEPKEKIGIVGRTGAGKSSITAALFQLYDIEGCILIDDVDITKMPLDKVRSKISIIPQEPVLFSGTMRKNLDPFGDYSDQVLWKALEQVELKELIQNLPLGLDSNVVERGTNFSVGQRQLVCLARAIVRDSKILIMDEATANVDPHTDILIQSSLRRNFSQFTVLTIAHRLHTVMESDKILVMDAGCLAEFDRPNVLLENKNGLLFKLVQNTGKRSAGGDLNSKIANNENDLQKKTSLTTFM